MSVVDALIIAALQEEFDAAREATAISSGRGVAKWTEQDADCPTPYLLGKYTDGSGLDLNIALARPTRMAGTATSAVAAALVERLNPRCLAMCGVCAGNPGEVTLGDVIVAEIVYVYDEGKRKRGGFEGDHRQIPLRDTWLRAAQSLSPIGLPSYCGPSVEGARDWLLECLYKGDDPRTDVARARHFPGRTWSPRVRSLLKEGLVRRVGQQLELTAGGKALVDEQRVYRDKCPVRMPFQIKVGPIASGNSVAKDGTTWDRLKRMGVRSIAGLEMEAGTIANIAHRMNVPNWAVAKGVMDYADPRKDDRYKQFAARASAEVLFRFLGNQLKVSDEPDGVLWRLKADMGETTTRYAGKARAPAGTRKAKTDQENQDLKTSPPSSFFIDGFSLPKPLWLDEARTKELGQLARAALFL